MGLLILLQVILDLGFIATATWLLIQKSKESTMEDPRLSKGLQLLSSKIAILQDLMDRSETMSRQLTQLIDGKQQDVQERMEEVEVFLHKIQKATEKSQEVASIFQDRIPHQEIIERQTSLKYRQAAKMANQGFKIEDITRQVDIPRGELELIIKLNRDRLLVDKEPEWLGESTHSSIEAPVAASSTSPLTSTSPEIVPPVNLAPVAPQMPIAQTQVSTEALFRAAAAKAANKNGTKEIRPVVFKHISALDDLG